MAHLTVIPVNPTSVKFKGLRLLSIIGARNHRTPKLEGKIEDIPVSSITWTSDLYNTEQALLLEYMALDKFFRALYPITTDPA